MASLSRQGSSEADVGSLLPSALSKMATDSSASTIKAMQNTTIDVASLKRGSSTGLDTLGDENRDPAHALLNSTEHEIDDQQPSLQPFFTLIEDTTSGTHHHPEVHYVFNDEDSDALVEATQHIEQLRMQHLSSLAQRQNSRPNSISGPSSIPNNPSHNERFIVVELGADGSSIGTASSLTPDWQVLDAGVSNAPMLEGNRSGNEDNAEEQRRLMLKIVGIGEIDDVTRDHRTGGDGVAHEMSIEDEVSRFAARMAELSKIVERAEKDVLALDMGTEQQGLTT